MHDSRTVDAARTPAAVHYTVKTTSRPSPSSPAAVYAFAHTHPNSHSSPQSFRLNSRTTPTASPRHPYSVGQSLPPKMSPPRAADARSPSPNYFGLIIESNMDPRDSGTMPTQNWSPPTSSVRSFAAALPKQVPLDANPEFEAFKRQADLNRGNGFGLSIPCGVAPPAATPTREALVQSPGCGPVRPRMTRCSSSTLATDQSAQEPMPARAAPAGLKDRPSSRMDVDHDSLHDSAYVSADSKRNSEASSLAPPTCINLNLNLNQNPIPNSNLSMPPRLEAPQKPERIDAVERRTALSRSEDRDPRLSVMGNRPEMPSPLLPPSFRPETVPAKMNEGGPSMVAPSQLRALLEQDGSETKLLLLDIRPSQSYTQSHVNTALNLCIPTTLLKRASHDLQKLQQTFHHPRDKDRFSRWNDSDYLVVYDAHSSEKREATAAINMIKKFTSQGYLGQTYILRGGFDGFRDANPDLVDTLCPSAASSGPNGSPVPPGLAPVIGGVMLPAAMTANPTNPFFSNIRQNMDLADGVGQLEIARPAGLKSPDLSRWLREAVSRPDKGKAVSDKFLAIEKDEQSRMQRAYAYFGTAAAKQNPPVQLCGIEQGGKNRYKDVLPFEHARVKLGDRSDGGSDYINASHVKASRSNKHYIATQGPLPATFEDFWSVIWDQDVRVIVMLTAESEGGQLKCHPYWSGKDYGSIRLKALSEKKVSLDLDKHRPYSNVSPSAFQAEPFGGRRRANTTTTLDGCAPTSGQTPSSQPQETPYVVIRKFALSHAAHPFAPMREITHLHYPSWPDFGAPAQPSHLLALVELSNVMQRAALPFETCSIVGGPTTAQRDTSDPVQAPPIAWYDEPEADARARPMLVHCSAGCGRTGTFCTVDSVIDMLKRQRLYASTHGASMLQRDAQGDVCMAGSDAGNMSPQTHTTAASAFFSSPRSARPSPVTLRRLSNNSTGSGGPMARTFAPALLDTSFVDDDGVDLIQRTVEDFRSQRISMVQSLRQFTLCYETVLEWVWRLQERGGTLGNSAANGGGVPGGKGRSRARSGSFHVRRA